MRCLGFLLVIAAVASAQSDLTSTTAAAATPSEASQLSSLVDVPLSAVVTNATETEEIELEVAAPPTSQNTTAAEGSTESQEATGVPTSSAASTAATTEESPPSSSTAIITPSPAPAPTAEASAMASESLPPPVEIPSPSPPAADLPSPPEFLSFNEWREKYVVLPEPATRRKRGAQRARQDAQGGGGSGGGGAAFDGDGADLGSLFSSEEGSDAGPGDGSAAGNGAQMRASARGAGGDATGPVPDVYIGRIRRNAPSESSSSSPLQPLPHVGTGDPSDPLLHLKDRSNYAAYECNAMVHRSSRQMKGATSILVEKKDRYMLTPCLAEPKFVEVELCDEIQIDTIVLASFELFSSMFKHFRMSCSVDYPGKPESWYDLGYFRARNSRGIQVFRTQAVPFCRYVRINFLSHYGSEFYCPVSLFRVYGYTQIDAWRKKEEEEAREARALAEALALEDDEEDELELEAIAGPEQVEEKVRDEDWEAEGKPEERNTTAPASAVEQSEEVAESTATTAAAEQASPSSTTIVETPPPPMNVDPAPLSTTSAEAASDSIIPFSPEPTSTVESNAPLPSNETTHISIGETNTSLLPIPSSATVTPAVALSASADETTAGSSPIASITSASNSTTAYVTSFSSTEASSEAPASSPPSSTATSETASSPPSSSPTSVTSSSLTSTISTSTSTRTTTTETPSSPPIVSTRPVPRNDSHSPPPRPPSIPPPSREPQPGESIYGTIMKRLASLEHNQTLAMHYIEAQSGMLREAFLRVELRLGEVEGARNKQEQTFRQSLLELELLRGELEKERLAISSQVNQLSQDIRLEKRLSIAQLIGLLVLVLFVGFTRGSPTSPFLHLTSAQAIRAAAKEEAKRKAARMEEETESPSEVGPRRQAGYRANSLTIARVPSKRHSSLAPKPAPRRHYGNGTSGASSSKAMLRSPRTWTPPPRHASAPPEDPFAASLATAPEGTPAASRGETTRRRGSKHAKYSHSVSYSRGEQVVGLAIDTASPRAGSPHPARAASSPSHHHLSRPFFLTRPSAAEDADTEPSEMGGEPEEYSASDAPPSRFGGGLNSNGLPSADTDGGYRTYSASEEEDESRPPSPPIRDSASPFLKPPRPVLGKRPVSSPGAAAAEAPSPVRFPAVGADTPRRVLSPEIDLPSPPPEPEVEEEGEGEKT